jgi:hypothetical protein
MGVRTMSYQSYFDRVPDFDYVNRNKGEKEISNYITVKNLFKRGKLRPDILGNLNFFTKYKIIGDDRPDNVSVDVYESPNLDWVVLISNNILNIEDEWPLPQRAFDDFLKSKYGTDENIFSGIHHYETLEIKDSKGAVVLEKGRNIPNTWNTNGNFIKATKTTINQIFAGDGSEISSTITVTMNSGIKDLKIGDEVLIENVSNSAFNGRFPITSVVTNGGFTVSFTYLLASNPPVAQPTINGTEQVIFTVDDNLAVGNAFFFEYFDSGLQSYQTIPSSHMLKSVTNYEHESKIEDDKRNIFILKPQYLNTVFNDLENIMEYKKGSTQYVSETLKVAENIRLYQY